MKNYTEKNIVFEEIARRETGSWSNYPCFGNPKWEINLSGILTDLIKLAAANCTSYASDLFIDWSMIEKKLEDYDFNGEKFIFGFREYGVDGNTFVLSRLNNYPSDFEKEIKELYMVEFIIEKDSNMYMRNGEITCVFGKAKVID